MHFLLRKLPPSRKHFFVRLKTAISSNACGTSTLKSPLSLGSDAPHVHPRLRKRPPRCTLDCGFKTSESPALRGFVAGPWALATAALYLVLKSNGLRHSKNLPVKFGFSPRTVPANIAKKLPAQRCSKPHFIAFFSLSHKRPTFAFTGESGLHTRLSEKDRTQRLARRNRGIPFCEHSVALRCQRNPFYSTVLLYTYISRFSVNPHHRQKRKSRRRCHRNSVLNRFSSRFLTSPTNGPRSLSQTKMGTHSALGERSHTRAHTAKQVAFRMGVVSLPSERSARSQTSPARVSERQTLPLLGLGRVYARRTQKACGTAMRLCVSLFRGVAAPLGCATLLVYTVAKDSGTIKLISILPLLTKLTLLKECTKPVPFHSTAN